MNPVIFLILTLIAQPDAMAARVQSELARGQRYDGEKRERLVALGKDAVPELCAQLHSYELPMELVEVLGELRDARAVPSLVEYLALDKPVGERPDEILTRETLSALADIGDDAAAPTLAAIAEDESALTDCRLMAFTGLLRFGSTQQRERAARWVLQADDAYPVNYRMQESWEPNGITPVDFCIALCEVSGPEADRKLLKYLNDTWGDEKLEIVWVVGKSLGTKSRPSILAALLHIALHECDKDSDDEGGEYETASRALDIVLESKALSVENQYRCVRAVERNVRAYWRRWGRPDYIEAGVRELRHLRLALEKRVKSFA